MKAIVLVIAIAFLALAQLTAIGEALYRWGAMEMDLGASLWEAFKTWLCMVGSGIVLGLAHVVIKD